MRTVRDVLKTKTKPFNEVSPSTPVIDALNLLNSVNLSYLVVMDGVEYKGIFSERDYSRNVILKGKHSDTTRVDEVMTTDLPIVVLSDTVEYCMNLMNSHKTRYLLAYDDRDFAGVITIHDLLRQVITNKHEVFDDSLVKKLLDEDQGERVY
jgi:CBS domain-containing protein